MGMINIHYPTLWREHNDQSLEHDVDLERFVLSDEVHRRLSDHEPVNCSFSSRISLRHRRFYKSKYREKITLCEENKIYRIGFVSVNFAK